MSARAIAIIILLLALGDAAAFWHGRPPSVAIGFSSVGIIGVSSTVGLGVQ